MKKTVLVVAILAVGAPSYAQFGGVGGAVRRAQQAQDTKKKIDDLTITEEEEQTIGLDVSQKVRQRFGVVQDPAVHKYVSLVGTTLAKLSDRPDLPWTFIVLDTDGVNAFASPGGYVHITRGALGLIENEAELAGVLGHEIGHVVRKHTINALRKNNAVQLGAGAASERSALLASVGNACKRATGGAARLPLFLVALEQSFLHRGRGGEKCADRQESDARPEPRLGARVDRLLRCSFGHDVSLADRSAAIGEPVRR